MKKAQQPLPTMDNTKHQDPANDTSPLNQEVVQMNVDETHQIIRDKASWFFWIAGLSLINTFLSAKGTYFIVGLAISQTVDGIVLDITGDINYLISGIAPLLFAGFGYFAFKLKRWAFILGSLVYIFDGLIYLLFEEWLAAGFHIFVLYHLYKGYKEITEYERQLAELGEM